jgi:hypothetical protein
VFVILLTFVKIFNFERFYFYLKQKSHIKKDVAPIKKITLASASLV